MWDVIADRIQHAHDSDGSLGTDFAIYLREYVQALLRSNPDASEKRKAIDILHRRFSERDPDYFDTEFAEALRAICTKDVEAARYWLRLLEPLCVRKIEEGGQNYFECRKLEHLAFLLVEIGRTSEARQLLEDNCEADPHLCMACIEFHRKQGDPLSAIRVAERGLSVFNHLQARTIREYLIDAYRSVDPEKHIANLTALFLDQTDWNHFDELKTLADGRWAAILTQLLERSHSTKKADILIREGCHAEALDVVLEQPGLYTFKLISDASPMWTRPAIFGSTSRPFAQNWRAPAIGAAIARLYAIYPISRRWMPRTKRRRGRL